MVIKARIEWLTSSKIHIGLPESQVVINGETVVLPRTTLKLDRYIQLAPWERQTGEPGSPWEWKRQAFYPKVRGRWYTAEMATYYNYEAWSVYNHHIHETPEPPRDRALEHHAQMLGIESGANRTEINAAFRSMAKKVHPDFGGTPDRFHQLLVARNSLLVKCLKV